MTEELKQLLENLKLRACAARFEEMLIAAEAAGTPIATFVTQLMRIEWGRPSPRAWAPRARA
jgi:hypothetical protein